MFSRIVTQIVIVEKLKAFLSYNMTTPKHPLFHQILPASSTQHQVQVKRKHTGIVQAKDEQSRVGKITEKQEVDSIY